LLDLIDVALLNIRNLNAEGPGDCKMEGYSKAIQDEHCYVWMSVYLQ
jgi:hypothetical protein